MVWIDSEGEVQAVITRDEILSWVSRWRRSAKAKELIAKIRAERKAFVDSVISDMQHAK